MAGSVYYIPCCGDDCIYGYIISLTDWNYCPSFKYSLDINGVDLGMVYMSCNEGCTFIQGMCYSGYGSCSGPWFSNEGGPCSRCCQNCSIYNGTNADGSPSYCADQNNRFYASKRYRSATITGGNTSDFGSTYTNFSVCNVNCGCTVIKQVGTNTLNLSRYAVSLVSDPFVETKVLIEKVRIGGSVVASTEGTIGYYFGWYTDGSMTGGPSNFSMNFPGGSLFD